VNSRNQTVVSSLLDSDSDEMLPLCVRTGTVMPGLGEDCAGVPGAGDDREDGKGRESVLTGRVGRSREISSSCAGWRE